MGMAPCRVYIGFGMLFGLFLKGVLLSPIYAGALEVPLFERNNYVLTKKKTLQGVGKDSSGLAYCPATKTFFIADDEGTVFEITPQGEAVRKIPLEGFLDVEGISYIGGSTFALIEEGLGHLDLVTIDSTTQALNIRDAKTYNIELNLDNNGLEGMAYSKEEDVFYLAKQKKPRKIYRVKLGSSKPVITIPFDAEWLPVRDISDLYLNSKISPHLIVLSSKSNRILEVDQKTGRTLSSFSLLLHIYLQKPEGLTFDEEGRMYIVTEGSVDNFFCFEPKDQATSKKGIQ